VRRSPFRSWAERGAWCLAVLATGCVATNVESAATPAPRAPGFAFSHDNSRGEHWPFGLNAITTKFVAEPARAERVVVSYWVVRTEPGFEPPEGELVARVRVRAEFPGGAFEPRRGVDYELVLGRDAQGAESVESDSGEIVIRSGAVSARGQRGFVVRARFLGDQLANEPPKSLLVELLEVRDALGRVLPLGTPRVARWLLVESAASPAQAAR
jgi:hypothetical protein